ncbi:hypothetical protein [Sphaerimonospora mesophila]
MTLVGAFRCCTCGGTGLVNDDHGQAATCRDCDGTGIDNHD